MSQSSSNARLYVFVIIAAVGMWLLSGIIFLNEEKLEEQTGADASSQQTSIEVLLIERQTLPRTAEIYGVTQAQRDVNLSAKTQGEVQQILAKEGAFVKRGAPIVRIDMQDRKERLAAVNALVVQRQQEYEAALKLKEKGFESDVSLARAKAALDSAKAEKKSIEMDIGFTTIRAPFSGILEKINVEEGDFAGVGVFGVEGSIARMLDLNPLLAVGEISGKERSFLNKGAFAKVIFPDGTSYEGTVSYVAQAATEASRSFPVEVSIPNDDYQLAAGVSVTVKISLGEMQAHIIPSSLLSLNDDGTLSVKALNEDNTVISYEVNVVNEAQEGVVVDGLPERIRIISSGQNFVSVGETVAQERISTAP